MQSLEDIVIIRDAFTAVSRRKILLSSLYMPTLYYKADLYLFIFLTATFWVAFFATNYRFFLLISALPFFAFFLRLDAALRNAYPILQQSIQLEKRYRSDFRFLRFKLFSQKLHNNSLSVDRIKHAATLLSKEHELTEIQSISSRPLVILITSIIIGIVTASAGMEAFWKSGFGLIAIYFLLLLLGYSILISDIFRPHRHAQKELELFLLWCLPPPY